MIKTDLNIRNSFKIFKRDNKESKISIKNYIDICNNYNQFLINKVIQGYEVTLPEKLGTLHIQVSKKEVKFNENGIPNLPPDWVKTKKLWDKCEDCKKKKQLVYHTNEHTGGITYKLIWSKKNSILKHKTIYSFRLTRDNKRAIHKNVLAGKEYYIK